MASCDMFHRFNTHVFMPFFDNFNLTFSFHGFMKGPLVMCSFNGISSFIISKPFPHYKVNNGAKKNTEHKIVSLFMIIFEKSYYICNNLGMSDYQESNSNNMEKYSAHQKKWLYFSKNVLFFKTATKMQPFFLVKNWFPMQKKRIFSALSHIKKAKKGWIFCKQKKFFLFCKYFEKMYLTYFEVLFRTKLDFFVAKHPCFFQITHKKHRVKKRLSYNQSDNCTW